MPSSQRIDLEVGGDFDATLAAEVFEPPDSARALLICFPGGGRNRHYFDLEVAGDSSYSFARSLAGRGYRVVTVDHLGVGDSTRPENGFAVTVERLIGANHAAVMVLKKRCGEDLPVIGVGHSMGAMLLLWQQDGFADYDALALLGFGHSGMPEVLSTYGRALASGAALANSVELARSQFPEGYYRFPEMAASGEGRMTPALIEAMQRSASDLLTVPGSLSLVPEVARAAAERIDVPVFSAIGDKDICGDFADQARLCGADGAVTAIKLADTRHNHFLYPSRSELYRALDQWLSALQEKAQRSWRQDGSS